MIKVLILVLDYPYFSDVIKLSFQHLHVDYTYKQLPSKSENNDRLYSYSELDTNMLSIIDRTLWETSS